MKEFQVTAEDDGLRIDKWCKKHVPIPYAAIQKLLRKKDIKIDGKRVNAEAIVRAHQTVTIYAELERASKPVPLAQCTMEQAREMVDAIIYEDKRAIIINKPAGLAVQGGTDIRDSVDARLDALATNGQRPKLVHRLDRDTSGVLLLAKTRDAASELTETFRAKTTRKIYWALVMGLPDEQTGIINLPLGKILHKQREKMSVVVDDSGKEALTRYRVVESDGVVSWLELMPVTGRTHQLRVHCQAFGHPIVGDGKYGGKDAFPARYGFDKQLHLHARYIEVNGNDGFHATAPLPLHMQRSWATLKFSTSDQGVSLLEQ